MTRTTLRIVLVAAVALTGACAGDLDTTTPPEDNGGAGGGEDNTYDHPFIEIDVWGLLDRIAAEGPPRFSSRVHSCPKIRYGTIGRLLASRGVDIANTTPLSAGQLYDTGSSALGAPNYSARSREGLDLTAAGASKLFDIFVAAAPEMIASLPTSAACMVGDQPAQLFNEAGQCSVDGITCLLGVPATPSHIEICNLTLSRASTPEIGQRMAIAVLAAAAHTCE